jgi:hypothetical protein
LSSTTEGHQGTRPVFFQDDLILLSVKALCQAGQKTLKKSFWLILVSPSELLEKASRLWL